MPRYLLDTSIVSAIADDPFGAVAARVTRHGIDRMCTSIIVAAELRFGAAKKGSKRLLNRIETALGNLDVQPFAAPADQCYADLRGDLERRGTTLRRQCYADRCPCAGARMCSSDLQHARIRAYQGALCRGLVGLIALRTRRVVCVARLLGLRG